MKQLFLLTSILFFTLTAMSQGHLQYSQSVKTQKILNPAYNRTGENISVFTLYRNQWTGMAGAPTSQTINVQMPFRSKDIGLGFTYLGTEWAFFRQTNFLASFSYTIDIHKHRISLGIQGGMNSYKLLIDEVISYGSGFSDLNAISPNVGFGAYYYSKSIEAGLSVPEIFSMSGSTNGLTEPGSSISMKNLPVFLFATYKKTLVEDISVRPAVFVRYIPDFITQIDLLANVIFKDAVSVGVGYRTSDALLFYINYRMKNNISIGYSYDFTTSELSHASNGSHEISLSFDISKKRKSIYKIRIN